MQLNSVNIGIIKRLLGARNHPPLKAILLKLPAVDLAQMFNVLNDRETRIFVDALMAVDKASDALRELPPPQLMRLLETLENQKLLTLLSFSPEDHSAYFLELLENDLREKVLFQMEPPRRRRLQQLMSYPPNSAGRDMDTNVFTFPANLTVQQAIDLVRQKTDEISIYYIYCVDPHGRLVGMTSLRHLVMTPAETPLAKIIKKDVVSVSPDTPAKEVARLVSHYDFVAIPVLNEEGTLLGVITVDDVVDMIEQQATAEIYATAGLQADDRVYSSVGLSVRHRLPWMVINLGTAIVASNVVTLFEATLSQVIVLATLNNIVSGMGGNAAIQALTVVTRGLSTGDFNFISVTKAVLKELSVGITLGISLGLLTGVYVYFWKGEAWVGVVIGLAMIINNLIANLSGAVIPILLRRLKWDPALGSGVIVTTFTDIFGFLSFLGLATLFMKMGYR